MLKLLDGQAFPIQSSIYESRNVDDLPICHFKEEGGMKVFQNGGGAV